MIYNTVEEGSFKYIETKGGEENLLLLHGLFGALSNFEGIISYFGDKYNVIVPILPIFDLPLRKVSVAGLVDHVLAFIDYKGYDKVHVLGNSLGGHIALLFSIGHPERISSITLTGSSGLFESAMGSSFPKRGDKEYIRKKTQDTFYDPAVASEALIEEVYDIVNDTGKAIRIIAMAKSAIRHNLGESLGSITAPTLLVWGKQDQVTPAFVGEKFHELISHSSLVMIDHCGHAPMMEHPAVFNQHLEAFLKHVSAVQRVS